MIELKNKLAIGEENLPIAGKELTERAERSINNVGASFYKGGLTVIADPTVYERTITIGKNTVKYAVFKTILFDKEGSFVKAGTISTSSLIRRLYPTVGSAVGMRYQLTPLNDSLRPADWVGVDSPKAIVEKAIADGLCFISDGTFQGGTAGWNAEKEMTDYDSIVIRDTPTYGMIACPEAALKFLASEK